MDISVTYMENLPSPNYKTRQFTRSITKTVPDSISKEDFLAEQNKLQMTCEALVKNDIARHIEAMSKGE